MLSDKVLYIAEVMNRNEYVPKMPNQESLADVFDTSYEDVQVREGRKLEVHLVHTGLISPLHLQPYNFKVSFSTTAGPASPSVGTTVRRLLKDTLAI